MKRKMTRVQLRRLLLREFKVLTEEYAGGESKPSADQPADVMEVLSRALGTEYVLTLEMRDNDNFNLPTVTCVRKNPSEGDIEARVFTINFAP